MGRWRAIGRFTPQRLARLRQVATIAHEHGRSTVADAAKLTGSSRNTIKDHIKALVGNRHLARHGAGRGTRYSLS
jgi:DeoR/GlpR family transcriptional regulator of sugar metabolism